MKIMLIDSKADVRTEVETRLAGSGLDVLSFSDSELAFLYLLSRFEEVDAVVLNSDVESRLLRRLAVLGPIAAVTYSGSDLAMGGDIVEDLIRDSDCGEPMARIST